MNDFRLISIALRFNEMINSRNLTGLSDLMTEDHTFIDISERVQEGKYSMIVGWAEFFREYPDYRNNFTRVTTSGNTVIMVGFSECSFEPLDGPSIWTAEIRDDLVAEWRVYEDNQEVRRLLNIE
jgi:predicted SnoaL-like aldol condensation-catalyzing enzyme